MSAFATRDGAGCGARRFAGRRRGRPGRAVVALSAGGLAVVAGVAALAGCSSTATPYRTPSSGAGSSSAASASASGGGATGVATAPTTAGPVPTASMTPLPAAAAQLTGTQLVSVLLPLSDFPAGFQAASSGPVSSGGSLTSAAPAYPLATISCSDFVQHLGSTGFGETGMAAGSVVGTGQAYDQFIYQFATAGEATAFVAGIESVARRCASFTAPAQAGTSGKFSLKATPGAAVAGRPSVELRQTGTVTRSSVTIDTLLTASGVDVFGASGVGLGAGAPAVPARQTLIYTLMQRQAAAAVLG